MRLTIGIDISKANLDIYFSGKHCQIANKSSAIKKFFSKVDKDCILEHSEENPEYNKWTLFSSLEGDEIKRSRVTR